jgi:hypothetical protein
MACLSAGFANYDNDIRAQKTVMGMKARLQKGGWPFAAPLGYRKVRDAQGQPSLAPVPETASLIQTAFEMVAAGVVTKAEALRHVTALGLRTRTGQKLSSQTFSDLLSKPAYAGRLCVPEWDIDIEGNFEPIVSGETFQRVQDVLNGRHSAKPRKSLLDDAFPLRRFIQCKCGRTLTGSYSKGRSKVYPYYHCPECRGVSVKKSELERGFAALLESLQPDPKCLPLFEAVFTDAWTLRRSEAANQSAQLKAELQRLKNKKQRIFCAFHAS